MAAKKTPSDHATGNPSGVKGRKAGSPKRRSSRKPSFIAGIGASAGGLEAFQEFLTHLPPDTGMAFVFVSHLDPSHKGVLPELLSHITKMPVFQISDGMTARPNTVYIIPPNADLSILHGTFSLLEPARVHGLRLPIDSFFRYLAEDQKEKSIGIILSGMGTDGSLGIRAIKEKSGMVMVQDPKTAKFNAMPQSAIAAGVADFIASPSVLPEKLAGFATFPVKIRGREPATPKATANTLKKIFILIRSRTGHDFSLYKKSTILRRVERRMNVHQLSRIEDYSRYIQENPEEIEILFKEFLIGVTNFFREPDSWTALREHALLDLVRSRTGEGVIRVWIPGCATGEEAYSIAILLMEIIGTERPDGGVKIQIFASDIYPEALDIARQGIYPQNIVSNLMPERLERFFVQDGEKYRVKKEIRDLIVFAQQNLIQDPPFTRIDLISCRNLFIYFTPELQKQVVSRFHYALQPGGILFLGPAETTGEFKRLFLTLDSKWKIFRRRELEPEDRINIEFPTYPVFLPERPGKKMDVTRDDSVSLPRFARHILLEYYTPSAVIVNAEGDILYFHGRTGRYLEHKAGKANLNIFAMAPEGIRFELTDAIRKAVAEGKDVISRNLSLKRNGDCYRLNLIVRPLKKPEEFRDYLMILFEEVRLPPEKTTRGGRRRIKAAPDASRREIEEELLLSKARLRTTVEEMEATREEQKSIYEELQSTNEEMQSTNEELTTSKEELQSLNEELTTVNSELEMKIGELSRSHDDMTNLLNGSDIAMVFLDINLNVRRFTKPVTRIINLLANDIGRPITDLVMNLSYGKVSEDVRDVLATLISKEVQVETKDGNWYVMRILPYRTSDNVIDGAVITFTDITPIKKLEQSLQKARAYAENIVETIREPLIVLTRDLRVVSASRSFYRTFGMSPGETVGQMLYSIGNRQWDIPELRKLLEEIIPKNTHFDDFMVEHEFMGAGHRVMLLNARRIQAEDPAEQFILLAIEDISGKPPMAAHDVRRSP